MKTIKVIATILVFSVISIGLLAQKKVVQESFWADGVCQMCKERIENAALIKGVRFVEWNKQSETVKVVFRSDKVTLDEIQKEVANAGHDTKKYKANKEVYKALPSCCAYREGVHKH